MGLLFLAVPREFYAQKSELRQLEQSKELSFLNTRSKSITIPFELVNNLIIVPVQINNSDTLRFILDTGINTSIICELSTGESLSLNYAREIQLQGLGIGKPLDAIHTYGNEINVYGITGINQDYFVLKDNIFHLSNKLGTPIHGILSFSVFNAFIVKIDYENKEITFYDPGYFRYRKNTRNYVTLPMIIHDKKPFIHMKIRLADGSLFPIKVLLDTGASNSLWINLNSLPSCSISGKARESFLGSGLSGDVYGQVTRFEELYIDNFRLNNVIVSLPDSSSIEHALGMDKRNGSVGAEILRRFTLIIDYPNELITFIKNSHYNHEFKYNMTGLELVAPYPDLNYFTISQVRAGSAAEKAGIMVNDEIVSINNKIASVYTLNNIYELFQEKERKKIKIVVNRDGDRKKICFRLEKFI